MPSPPPPPFRARSLLALPLIFPFCCSRGRPYPPLQPTEQPQPLSVVPVRRLYTSRAACPAPRTFCQSVGPTPRKRPRAQALLILPLLCGGCLPPHAFHAIKRLFGVGQRKEKARAAMQCDVDHLLASQHEAWALSWWQRCGRCAERPPAWCASAAASRPVHCDPLNLAAMSAAAATTAACRPVSLQRRCTRTVRCAAQVGVGTRDRTQLGKSGEISAAAAAAAASAAQASHAATGTLIAHAWACAWSLNHIFIIHVRTLTCWDQVAEALGRNNPPPPVQGRVQPVPRIPCQHCSCQLTLVILRRGGVLAGHWRLELGRPLALLAE